MRWLRLCAGALAVCATCFALAGCKTAPPGLASTWPVATSEATVTPSAESAQFPLTGRPVLAGAQYAISPICAKLVDSGKAASFSGVDAADVVYETAESDSATQIAALFQSATAKAVGPLSGAGLPDLRIVPQYHAALFSTGATASVAASIKRAGLLDLSLGVSGVGLSYTKLSKSATATFLSGAGAAAQVAELGSSIASDSARLRFSDSVESTGSATIGVSIPFSASQIASWKWSSATHRYARSRNGHAQRDAGTHKQLSARNVVVMWAKYSALDSDIAGPGGFDVQLGGSGQVTVFRDGQRFDGRWRADAVSPPTFATESGEAIRLAPGTTWFEVIPLSANITMR